VLELPASCEHKISTVEKHLESLKVYSDGKVTEFPFKSTIKNSLGSQILQDLSKSWDAYTHLKTVGLVDILDNNLHDGLKMCFTMIKDERERVEEGLLKIMTFVPTTTNIPSPSANSTAWTTSFSTQVSWNVLGFRLKRTINRVPIPTVQDLARISFMPKMLKNFNPFLSEAGTKKFQAGIFQWLNLCVIEDKLQRMLGFARKEERQPLERELEDTKSQWSAQEYPEWRVFEMEQRLQIRNVQFQVARHLMSHPGFINTTEFFTILAPP
jgi:hypothetical protein